MTTASAFSATKIVLDKTKFAYYNRSRMKSNKSKLTLFLAIGLTIFSLLPLLAPIAAKLGINSLADAIYWTYQWFCHQRPWRSYHLFDYQLAMDARMMLMFGTMATSAYIIYFKQVKPLKPFTAVIFGLLLISPLAADGLVQAFSEVGTFNDYALPAYESTNFIRSLTGLLFGIGIAFAVFPYLNFEPVATSTLKLVLQHSLLAASISFLFIPVLVLGWSITSSKYKPSSLLIDNTRRYPGYNYEITSGAGHSTIKRSLQFNEETIYINRAKQYNRQGLLDEYYRQQSN